MKINSNDQLDLTGSCLANCDGIRIYYNFTMYTMNSLLNTWIPFTNDSYFYPTGNLNSSLVIKKDIFRDFSTEVEWKIELKIYLVLSELESLTGSTSTIFYVNFPPKNGMCDINPTNGTTNMTFHINCYNWVDLEGSVALYSYFGYYFYFNYL